MKKIVVSTFNNSSSSYGALLQSCALYAFLTGLGYDVRYVTICNRNNTHKSPIIWAKQKLTKLLSIRNAKAANARRKAFAEFADRTQKRLIYENLSDLYRNPPQADVYVSGSDQVWNPTNIHEDFFLTYAPESATKISYAASMGYETVPQQSVERFARYLSAYHAVSVREDTMVDLISPFVSCPIYQHVDPVLLLTASEWEKYEKPYAGLKYSEYIMVYPVEWTFQMTDVLRELQKASGLRVVLIGARNRNIPANQVIYDASPGQFLYLLHHSRFVVASSFHGVAFSIVYRRPFVALSGSDKPTRIQSMLRHFGLEQMDWHTALQNGFPNAQRIEETLKEDRISAERYLRQAIQ